MLLTPFDSTILKPNFDLERKMNDTVVSYSNENFPFKLELPAGLLLHPKKEGHRCKLGHSHLNETLSFIWDGAATVP